LLARVRHVTGEACCCCRRIATVADIVAIPDCNVTPEQLVGLATVKPKRRRAGWPKLPRTGADAHQPSGEAAETTNRE
jgi:hypothetical protein